MARAFDITSTTSRVELNGSSQGTVSFTISNKLGAAVTVRASVSPTGTSKAEWMSFPEGAERALTADGTAVIPVKVSVPAGTPPGAYGFGLLVASLTNPDENYDQGPAVAFTVAEAKAPVKKPFPWWIVAVAAGVVLLTGGVVFALVHKAPAAPGLGEACATKGAECGANLECGAGKVCVGQSGFSTCTKPEQCATGRCEAGTCKEQSLLGDSCNSADDCHAPLTCVPQGLCLIPLGKPCASPQQCVTGACQGTPQVCTQPVVPCTVLCPARSRCVNNQCRPFLLDSSEITPDLYKKLGINSRNLRLP